MAWQRVASTADLESANPFLGVRIGKVEIAIARVDGLLFAVDDICTHAGCQFSEDAELIGDLISCYCHGSEFDIRSGEVTRGPADQPLRTFPVRIAGDSVEIEIDVPAG